MSTADPRQNAPARISDLLGDERRKALVARAEAQRLRFMATYRNPPPPSLLRRLLGRVFG